MTETQSNNTMRPQLFTFYEIIDDVVIPTIRGINDYSIDGRFCCNICYEVLGRTNIITKVKGQTMEYFKHANTTISNNNSDVYCSKVKTDEYDTSIYFNQIGDNFRNTIRYFLGSTAELIITYNSLCCITNPTNKYIKLKNRLSVEIFDTHIIFDNIYLSFTENIECNGNYTYLCCTKDSFIKYMINWKNLNKKALKTNYIHKYKNKVCIDCLKHKKEYISKLTDKIKGLVPVKYLDYLPSVKLEYVLKYFNEDLSRKSMSTIKNFENKDGYDITKYQYKCDYWFFDSHIMGFMKTRLSEDGFNIDLEDTYYNHMSIEYAINHFRNNRPYNKEILQSFLCNIFNVLSGFNYIYKLNSKKEYDFLIQYCIYKFKSNTTNLKHIRTDNNFIDTMMTYTLDNINYGRTNKNMKSGLYKIFLTKKIMITKDWELFNKWTDKKKCPIPIPVPVPVPVRVPIRVPIPPMPVRVPIIEPIIKPVVEQVIQPKNVYLIYEKALFHTLKNLTHIDIIVNPQDKLQMFLKLNGTDYILYNKCDYWTKSIIGDYETHCSTQKLIDHYEIPNTTNIFNILQKLNVSPRSSREVIIEKLQSMITT